VWSLLQSTVENEHKATPAARVPIVLYDVELYEFEEFEELLEKRTLDAIRKALLKNLDENIYFIMEELVNGYISNQIILT
jgi:hypothetical protein